MEQIVKMFNLVLEMITNFQCLKGSVIVSFTLTAPNADTLTQKIKDTVSIILLQTLYPGWPVLWFHIKIAWSYIADTKCTECQKCSCIVVAFMEHCESNSESAFAFMEFCEPKHYCIF
jgi:hypothetical protein